MSGKSPPRRLAETVVCHLRTDKSIIFARKLRLSEKSVFHIDDNSINATQPHKDWDTYRL